VGDGAIARSCPYKVPFLSITTVPFLYYFLIHDPSHTHIHRTTDEDFPLIFIMMFARRLSPKPAGNKSPCSNICYSSSVVLSVTLPSTATVARRPSHIDIPDIPRSPVHVRMIHDKQHVSHGLCQLAPPVVPFIHTVSPTRQRHSASPPSPPEPRVSSSRLLSNSPFDYSPSPPDPNLPLFCYLSSRTFGAHALFSAATT
jgi:hypothetical protein